MHSISVSNLGAFKRYLTDEDLPLSWLLEKLEGRSEQTPEMLAGEAFHKALENIDTSMELGTLASGNYRFDFNCDAAITLADFCEIPVQKEYGELLVRGRVDVIDGKMVVDYKTTGNFDAERLLSGSQWSFYLDMLDCDDFKWEVFVLKERAEYSYEVTQHHTLRQKRYPNLAEDCARLAREYLEFISERDYHIVRAPRQETIRDGSGVIIGDSVAK